MRQHAGAAKETHAVEEWRRCRSPCHRDTECHEEVAGLPARRLGQRPELRLERVFRIKEWLFALANRLSDAMEGLNGVRQGQEELNNKLGEIIFEKPPDAK